MDDKQTKCAVCGELKATPLRRDEMGGNVCLTCVEKELDRLRLENSDLTERLNFMMEESSGDCD